MRHLIFDTPTEAAELEITQSFKRFHDDIQEQLHRLVSMGAMFGPDHWAEEKLQFVLERHKQIAQLMGMGPA